jgi:hypothetical protein
MLGLIAWILPVVNLLRNKKQEKKKWVRLSFKKFERDRDGGPFLVD